MSKRKMLWELFISTLYLSTFTFGGGFVIVTLMKKKMVDQHHWIDEKEMLDEWGREFFAESRRRIDLIRYGKFCSGTWWDKTPDADRHTEIFPIMRPILNSNPSLVQNPGYNN